MSDLDLACWSARDVLELIGAVRDTRPRDGLRAFEDALLDVTLRTNDMPSRETDTHLTDTASAELGRTSPHDG